MLGTIGQLLVLTAFVACGLSVLAYFLAARRDSSSPEWMRIGRAAWGVVSATVLISSALLMYLILTHQFQYAYVYQYTSLDLPGNYLFSSFWAGQEGSFLLWILYTCIIGLLLIRWAKSYEAPVLAVIAVCQFFLLSMIVGLEIGSLPIGSSPFALLIERFPDAPVFQQQPDFIPADGNGLNDLLQNYWMVIHPPTLFVGFATMIVPFAYAVAGLWTRRYTEWVRPALPWALFATVILGIGIMLGGYWAYVTLSFGGYWAWDPVENSSLVPWMIAVAAVHTMIAQKKSRSNHRAAILLSIVAYMLVIYSTFLTRSGILGDISVHSFVDLGLSNQLLIWILAMGMIGFGLFAHRYNELPTPQREARVMSREFLIFSGAALLCAAAAVILLGTSAPILGRIFRDNPSAVPLEFYNDWTLPIAIGFVLLAGLAQLFWWNKMSPEMANKVLLPPLGLAVVCTAAILIFTPFVPLTVEPAAIASESMPVAEAGMAGGLSTLWASYGTSILMMLLLFAGFFALFGNSIVLWKVGRGNPRMAGGALSHVGFALLILGIISSSGFSQPLVEGTGVQMGDSRDNFIVNRGETMKAGPYEVTYRDREPGERGRPVYVLDFVHESGREFTLRPVVYKSNKDQWIQHPDLKTYFEKDVYAAVAPHLMFDTGNSGSDRGTINLARGDSILVGAGEYKIRFNAFDTDLRGVSLPDSVQIAVAAVLQVTKVSTGETRELRPVYMIMEDRSQQFLQNRVEDWNLGIAFTGMNVDNGQVSLDVLGASIDEEDWIVVQAYEKPLINLLWTGFIILAIGFGISIYRRISDGRFERRRQEEFAHA